MKNIWILLVVLGGLNWYLTQTSDTSIPNKKFKQSQVTEQSGLQILDSLGGPGFDIHDYVSPGQATVVEFYVSWCPGCKALNSNYTQFMRLRPDVAIRRIKMIDKWGHSWAKKQYGLDIHSTPHIIIFNPEGQIAIQDKGKNKEAYNYLYKWMNSEAQEARKKT